MSCIHRVCGIAEDILQTSWNLSFSCLGSTAQPCVSIPILGSELSQNFWETRLCEVLQWTDGNLLNLLDHSLGVVCGDFVLSFLEVCPRERPLCYPKNRGLFLNLASWVQGYLIHLHFRRGNMVTSGVSVVKTKSILVSGQRPCFNSHHSKITTKVQFLNNCVGKS